MTPTARTYIPLSKLNWRLILLACAVWLVCSVLYHYLDFVAHGSHTPPWAVIIEQTTGIVAGLIVFPLVYWMAVHFPLLSKRGWRFVPVHLAAVCVISFLHTSLMAMQRNAIFPVLGMGHYDYGYMPVRYVMEFSNFFVVYFVKAACIYLFYEIRFAREREVRQAQLEASLAQTQLQNLRLQLEPHFLFNALNAISARIYEDPRAADEMIGRLSDLLRRLLKNDRSQEVTLGEELELLGLYTRIMEARLEDRLCLRMEIDPGVKNALVPQLLLQPLVENAIRHGVDAQTFRVDVTVAAHRVNGHVHISIRDRGPGMGNSAISGTGIGLRNTAERLSGLYGADQRLTVGNAEDGGALVRVQVPFHTA